MIKFTSNVGQIIVGGIEVDRQLPLSMLMKMTPGVILSTFYEQFFCTKAFLSLQFQLVFFWLKNKKSSS
jgi:hypothetical protein